LFGRNPIHNGKSKKSVAAMSGLMKALESSFTFSMPLTIDPLYIGVEIVVVLSPELSKQLCKKKSTPFL